MINLQKTRDLAMLDLVPPSDVVALCNELETARSIAKRYLWLREQTWDKAELCVVTNPKHSVKLGHDCPSHMRLDAFIDARLHPTA